MVQAVNGYSSGRLAVLLGRSIACRPPPVLADMLEEAGCCDPQLLGHLRSPGPHVRGCFVVDLLLGKS